MARPAGGTGVRTFILIPGAGGVAWYWHRVVPLLAAAGHEAVAVDLPGDDDQAGLPEYARIVTAAIGERRDVVLVAQSLGGFTAPMVAAEIPVSGLVFVNAMIPPAGGGGRDVGRVAASRGRFPAPMVAAEIPVSGLVFVNAMIPLPGETPSAWSGTTGSGPARAKAAGGGGYT